MKYFFIIWCLLFSINTCLVCQSDEFFKSENLVLKFSQEVSLQRIEIKNSENYLSIALQWSEEESRFSYRTFSHDYGISDWQEINDDVHVSEENHTKSGNALLILGKGIAALELKQINKESVSSVILNLKISHDVLKDQKAKPNRLNSRNSCTCDELPFFDREGWGCPWGDESPNFTPTYSEISHMVIHHQAGNAPEPYDAVVRAIWNYHVNTNGWDDIGYNWLIAPDGTVFKGRAWLNGDQNVRGAHTCACNSNKMGICMLGNFTNELPPSEQYEALKNFMVWKACELTIRPDKQDQVGRRISGECTVAALSNISGHKDVCGTSYTECPGNAFYPLFPQLKIETIEQYLLCSDTLNTAIAEGLDEMIKIIQLSEGFKVLLADSYQPTEIKLINIKGEIIYENSSYDGVFIPTTNLPSNLYLIFVKFAGRMATKKVIIMNK